MASRIALALTVLMVLTPVRAQPDRGGILHEANLKRYRTKAEQALAKEVVEQVDLAVWGLENGFIDESQEILAGVISRNPGNEAAVAALRKDWPEPESIAESLRKKWDARRTAWRRRASQRRLAIAQWCEGKKLSDEARAEYESVLRIDPDHERARKGLGFVRYRDRWVTKEDARMLEKGLVLHEGIAWIPAEAAEALKRGEYPVGGAFVKLAEADRLCADWSRAWKLRSRHFDLTCNLGFAECLTILRGLECGHRACAALWGMPPEAPKGKDAIPVEWSRTWEQFQVNVGDVDVSGGSNHYRDGFLWTCGDREGGGVEDAARKVYEYAVQHVPGSYIDKVRDTVGCWVFYAAGSCTSFCTVGPDGTVLLDAERALRTYANDGRTLLKKYGPQLLPRINDTKADAWKPEFYPWWNTGICFVAFLHDTEEGRHRDALRRFVSTVSRGRAKPELFQQVFGRPIESFHEAFAKAVEAR